MSPPSPDELLSHAPAVRALARRLLRDDHAAEDVVQQTWLQALRRPPRQRTRLLAWLLTVARRLALTRRDQGRAQDRREQRAAPPARSPSPDEAVDRLLVHRDVVDAVVSLDEPFRSTLVLRYLEDLSTDAVAKRQGVPAATVRVRLVRAREKLRARLAGRYGDRDGTWRALAVVAGLVSPGMHATATFAGAGSLTAGALVMDTKLKLALACALALLLGFAVWYVIDPADDLVTPALDLAGADQDEPAPDDTAKAEGLSVSRFRPDGEPKVTEQAHEAPDGVIVFKGRVLDEARRPVPGARVALVSPRLPSVNVRSRSDGSFRIAVSDDREDLPYPGNIRATLGDRCAEATASPPGSAPDRVRDIGALVLQSGFVFRVRVVQQGRPIAGARVLRSEDWPLVTNANGVATDGPIPQGEYEITIEKPRVGFAETRLYVPSTGMPTVELSPTRAVTITVVDSAGRPVPNAKIQLYVPVPETSGRSYDRSIHPVEPPAPTDAYGQSVVYGMRSDRTHVVEAHADGYVHEWNPGPHRAVVEPDGTTARLVLEAIPEKTWPIHAGECPIPADGTPIELLAHRSLPGLPIKGSARVVNGHVVAHGVQYASIARTPDGHLASLRLHALAKDKPVTFRKPRTLTVRVRGPGGQPMPGVRVNVIPDARSWWHAERADTDADGIARLGGFFGGHVGVVLGSRDYISNLTPPAGEANLDSGDQTVDIVAGARVTARLRLQLGSTPRLPSRLKLYVRGGYPETLDEDPEKGELVLTILPHMPRTALRIQVTAGAWGRQFVDVPAEVTGEFVETLRFAAPARLAVEVRPPDDGVFDVRIQKWDEDDRTWRSASRWPRAVPGSDGGSIVFEPLDAGRYRMFDRLSAALGPTVTIAKGNEASTTFDLRGTRWLKVRVETPRLIDLAKVRVATTVSDDPRTDDRPDSWRGGSVNPDGSFRVRVPGGVSVTVSAWHPVLTPAADSRDVVTSTGPVVLRLVAGARASIGLASPIRPELKIPVRKVQALLYRGKPGRIPVHRLTAALENERWTFGGFAPGTWTVVILADEWAPLVFERRALGEDVTHLGDHKLTYGQTLQVTQPAKGPRHDAMITISAIDGFPIVRRFRIVRSQTMMGVLGLHPGRYRVEVQLQGQRPSRVEVTVGDTPVTVPLRNE
ncbi:MAG: hypothetical protein CMJ83_12500 [Planctomycetes bacterium]|nr:hypothetical protein [Planctomycetota bacterium]